MPAAGNTNAAGQAPRAPAPPRPSYRPVGVLAPRPQRPQVFRPLPSPRQPVFAAPIRQARQRTQQAANRLGNRPQLLIPQGDMRDPHTRAVYLRQQTQRVKALAQSTGAQAGYEHDLARAHAQGTDPSAVATPLERLIQTSNRHDRAVLEHWVGLLQHHSGAELVRSVRTGAQQTGLPVGQFAADVGRNIVPGREGPAHARLSIGPASIDLTSLSDEIGQHLAGNPLSAFLKGTAAIGTAAGALHVSNSNFAGRALNDVIDFPSQVIPGLAALGSAAGRAVLGHPAQLGQQANAFVQPFTHPLHSFSQHPLMTGLAYAGVVGGLDSALARIGESGALGAAARAAATAQRPDRLIYDVRPRTGPEDVAGTAPGTRLTVPREYGRGLVHRAAQQAFERRARARGGNPDVATAEQVHRALYGGGAATRVLPRAMQGLLKPGAVDRVRAVEGEMPRRQLTAHAVQFARQHAVHDLVPLIYEGIVRRAGTLHADLAQEAARLQHEEGPLQALAREDPHARAQLAQNRANQEQIQRVQADPNLDRIAPQAFEAAGRLVGYHAPVESEIARHGGMAEGQLRAKLLPFAQAHLGAVTNEEAHAYHGQALEDVARAHVAQRQARAAGDHQGYQAATAALHDAEDRALQWGPFNPEHVTAYRGLRAQVAAHRQQIGESSREINRLSHRRSRLVGAQQVKRGQEQMAALRGEGAPPSRMVESSPYALPGHDAYLGQHRVEREQNIRELVNEQAKANVALGRLSAERERAVREHGQGSPEVRAAAQNFQDVWVRANTLAQQVQRLKEAHATRLTGQPDKPAGEIRWFHGTRSGFEGQPTAKGMGSDLGVYLTSDPHYAEGYAGQRALEAGNAEHLPERASVVHLGVEPRKVLDMRRGTADPHEVAKVIDAVLGESKTIAEKQHERGNPARFDPEHPEQAVLGPTLVRDLRSFADELRGGGKLSIGEWREMDRMLMHDAPAQMASAIDRYAPGTAHLPMRVLLRKLGYDAIRKADMHADALVVLDESRLRAPYQRVAELTRKEFKRQQALGEVERQLTGARGRRQELSQAFRESKQAAEAARPRANQQLSGLRAPDGHVFTTKELHDAVMAETEGRGVGFLGHNLPSEYARLVRSRSDRPGIERFRRTGEAFRKGAYDRSPDAVVRQFFESANTLSGHRAANAIAERFGVGRFTTPEEAERALAALNYGPNAEALHTAGGFVVHRIGPDQVVGSELAPQPRGLAGALEPEHDLTGLSEAAGPAKYTLLPRSVAERVHEHDALATQKSLGRAARWVTQRWRHSSLFTSPRWIFGNPQELSIRNAFDNVNPLAPVGVGKAHAVGGVAVDEWRRVAADESRPQLERDMARANLAAYAAGTHYGSLGLNTVREDESFLWSHEHAPVQKVVAGWEAYKAKVGGFQQAVERNANQAALGREAQRQIRGFAVRWGKLTDEQDRAVRAWARGTLDPNESARLGQKILETMGNWTQLTPFLRDATQLATPFGLWWLNSLRFIYRTLPSKHPFKTAIIAATEMATHNQRAAQGQGQDAGGEPFLGGGVHVKLPVVGGVTVNPTYYSPMGIGVDPVKTAADMVLPQAMDPLMALRGVDALTGRKLQVPGAGGKGRDVGNSSSDLAQEALHALNAFIEPMVPGLRQGRQLLEAGSTPFANANIVTDLLAKAGVGRTLKAGTSRGIAPTVAKILSPFRFNYDKRQPGASLSNAPGSAAPSGPVDPARREAQHLAGQSSQRQLDLQRREASRLAAHR